MNRGCPEIGEIVQNDQKPLCYSSEGQDFWSIILDTKQRIKSSPNE